MEKVPVSERTGYKDIALAQKYLARRMRGMVHSHESIREAVGPKMSAHRCDRVAKLIGILASAVADELDPKE